MKLPGWTFLILSIFINFILKTTKNLTAFGEERYEKSEKLAKPITMLNLREVSSVAGRNSITQGCFFKKH